jgi:hypothetical protein
MTNRTDPPSTPAAIAEPSSQSSGQPSGHPSAGRRRLLRGAAGALPSVLTLASGAAVAAGSTLSCFGRTDSADLPERFSPTDDHWVRAQTRVAQYQNRHAYCITSPSNACVDGSNQVIPGSTWSVDGANMTAGMGQNDLIPLSDRAYGLVYIDSRGSITTLNSTSSINLQPVTDSCWTSMLGNRTVNLG